MPHCGYSSLCIFWHFTNKKLCKYWQSSRGKKLLQRKRTLPADSDPARTERRGSGRGSGRAASAPTLPPSLPSHVRDKVWLLLPALTGLWGSRACRRGERGTALKSTGSHGDLPLGPLPYLETPSLTLVWSKFFVVFGIKCFIGYRLGKNGANVFRRISNFVAWCDA